MTMKIEARLTYDKVRFDQEFDAHLVVSVTAPTVAVSDKRAPLCIIPVIDVSPSMAGPKFEYAKKSVLKLIDNLQGGDYCGLLKFSAHAEVVIRPEKITPESKELLKSKVGDLRLGSATNIADALLKGLEIANAMDLPAEVTTRVILFTDGQANTGIVTKSPDILRLVEPNMGLATVSAFGYGSDADQDLLSNIAKLGKANYAFVSNPDDALTAFGKELGGLLSTYATDLVLDVAPLAGHQVLKVISDVEADESDIGGEVTIKIPNLLGEETRHIVMGIKLAPQKNSFPRAVNVFDVKLAYDILDPTARKERKDADTKVKVQFVKPGEEQDKPNKEIDKVVGLAQVVRAQIEAEEMAKKGDFSAAVYHMQNAGDDVKSRGLVGVSALASSVGSRLVAPGIYANSSSYLRSVAGGVTRGVGVASYDSSAAFDLQEQGLQLNNSVQSSTSASFADAPASTQTGKDPLNGHGGAGTAPLVDLVGISTGGAFGGTLTVSTGVTPSIAMEQPHLTWGASPSMPSLTGTSSSVSVSTSEPVKNKGKKKVRQSKSTRW